MQSFLASFLHALRPDHTQCEDHMLQLEFELSRCMFALHLKLHQACDAQIVPVQCHSAARHIVARFFTMSCFVVHGLILCKA